MRTFWIIVLLLLVAAAGLLLWPQGVDTVAPVAEAPVALVERVEPAAVPRTESVGVDEAQSELEKVADAPQTQPAPIADAAPGAEDEDAQRFLLRGKGTETEPYDVPWELLASAAEEYQPHRQKHEVPQRVKQLDGKRVRITGYSMAPVMTEAPEEILVMMNEWDGCCIGMPPTPYDSIEVKLAGAGPDAGFGAMVMVTGTLRVDPSLAGRWLVALYRIEEAKVTAVNF